MALHNPNNWHWVNKDVSEWARTYLQEKLTKIEGEQDGVAAKITRVSSMDGDVDVSQRKGKVITLFDVKLGLEFQGHSKDDDDVEGSITIPEVAHDTEEDEYVFEVDINDASKSKLPVKDLVKSSLIPQIRKELQKLAPALITEHGRDIQHAPGSGPPTGYSTPVNKVTSSTAAQANNKSGASASKSGGDVVNINTVPLSSTTEFRTSAEELFVTFTDPGRIAAFTRSTPKVFDGPKPGGKFELFGGGVQGEYVSLTEPKQIVQKWRLAHWPQGHYSTLTLDFDQDNVNSVTNMRVNWDRVPVGEEDSTRDKWGEYYVRSLKTTFGFGTIL